MNVRGNKLFLLLIVMLFANLAEFPSAFAEPEPVAQSDSAKPGQYQMMYHWNRLDWTLPI
jgi:hypothetical protein